PLLAEPTIAPPSRNVKMRASAAYTLEHVISYRLPLVGTRVRRARGCPRVLLRRRRVGRPLNDPPGLPPSPQAAQDQDQRSHRLFLQVIDGRPLRRGRGFVDRRALLVAVNPFRFPRCREPDPGPRALHRLNLRLDLRLKVILVEEPRRVV